jgi:hypothetical protein
MVRRPGPRVHELSLNESHRFSYLRLRLKMRSGISRSNLSHRSRHGRFTVAPADDAGGAMNPAAVPQPLLRRGSPGATASLLRRGLALWWWRGTANSPRGILGGDGDRSSARDGVPFFLKLGDCEGVL